MDRCYFYLTKPCIFIYNYKIALVMAIAGSILVFETTPYTVDNSTNIASIVLSIAAFGLNITGYVTFFRSVNKMRYLIVTILILFIILKLE